MQFEGDFLFSTQSLDDFLRERLAALSTKAIEQTTEVDETAVAKAVARISCEPLRLLLDQVDNRVDDTSVTVRDYGRMIEVPGFRASRIIPYRGEPRLWGLTPSTFDSCPPMGRVSNHALTIAVSVPKRDVDAVAAELDGFQRDIAKYIAWQMPQLVDFNARIEATVRKAIKAAQDNDAAKLALLNKISGKAS